VEQNDEVDGIFRRIPPLEAIPGFYREGMGSGFSIIYRIANVKKLLSLRYRY